MELFSEGRWLLHSIAKPKSIGYKASMCATTDPGTMGVKDIALDFSLDFSAKENGLYLLYLDF